jgi:hypothetical protein
MSDDARDKDKDQVDQEIVRELSDKPFSLRGGVARLACARCQHV